MLSTEAELKVNTLAYLSQHLVVLPHESAIVSGQIGADDIYFARVSHFNNGCRVLDLSHQFGNSGANIDEISGSSAFVCVRFSGARWR